METGITTAAEAVDVPDTLPDDVREYLWVHYERLESLIDVELELAGIKVVEKDFGDCDWCRFYSFATQGGLDRFLSMAGYDNHPIKDWLDDIPDFLPKFTVCIDRRDMEVLLLNLHGENVATFDNYFVKRELLFDEWRNAYRPDPWLR